MKAALERRVQALELMGHMEGPSSAMNMLELAMYIGLALRRGGEARKELDAADASLEPERRVKLTKILEGARVVGKLLANYRPNNETPLSARLPPERLGVLLGASSQGSFSASVPAPLPADPPLQAEEIEVLLPEDDPKDPLHKWQPE